MASVNHSPATNKRTTTALFVMYAFANVKQKEGG